LDDVCTIECESVFDCMIILSLALAYPSVICCVFCCVVLSFAMIINLLMWADARNTCGQHGGDGSAT